MHNLRRKCFALDHFDSANVPSGTCLLLQAVSPKQFFSRGISSSPAASSEDDADQPSAKEHSTQVCASFLPLPFTSCGIALCTDKLLIC